MTDMTALVRQGYDHAAQGWASGAELAYVPMAAALLDQAPRDLSGLRVLDVGTGTGAVSRLAHQVGAAPVGIDASHPMLAYHAQDRPPGAVADAICLPFADNSVDGAAAAFVLNHLPDPVAALVEMARVVRPGGFVLASVFSTSDRPPAKAAIDHALTDAGWTPPVWYQHVKTFDGQLGSAPSMRHAARRAGLCRIHVTERPIDTGITDPQEIVRFRLSQPHISGFIAGLPPATADAVTRQCVAAAAETGAPLAPGTVMLSATVRRPTSVCAAAEGVASSETSR